MTAQRAARALTAPAPVDAPILLPVSQPVGWAVLLAIGCGSLYYAATKLGLALRFPNMAVSALWPSNALLFATLLLTSRRHWWIPLLAVIPAHFAAHAEIGLPVWRLLWQIGHNSALTICAAGVLRLFVGARNPFQTLHDVSIYICVAVFAVPAVITLISPSVIIALVDPATAAAQPALLAWRSTYLSNAVAFLTLTPAVVLWASNGLSLLRRGEALRYAEAALIGVTIYVIFAFFFGLSGKSHLPAALYALLAPVVWAAARFGVAGAASALSVIALCSPLFALEGRGPFATSAEIAEVFGLQMFLLAISLPVLILAILMDERVRRTEAIREGARALRESEERYRAIVESQTELVCRYLPDTTLTFVNSAYCRFFNRSRQELVGSSFLQFIPEASREMVLRHVAFLAVHRRPVTVEHQVLLPDGGTGWQQWIDCAIEASDGSVAECQAIGRDITGLKRAEESLRQSDERFRLVLQATDDVIFDWNIITDRLWWSANGQKFFDAAPDGEHYGLSWWADRIHPDDRRRVTVDLHAAIDRGEELWEAEYRFCGTNGATTYINERGYIVRGADGRPLRMIGSLMDITDRKRLEEANRRVACVARLATVGEITASIAHEINQPLGAILNNSEAALLLLQSGSASPGDLKQILNDIRQDDLRAGNVIRRLRALLQDNELQPQPLDVNEVASEVVSLVRVECRRRRVLVETSFAAVPLIQGDRIQLQQVLLNLLLNSMDALADTPEPFRRVSIRTRTLGRTAVELSVTDAGCGISAELLPKLFDSFCTSKANGMGLGLSIARSIVEAHGGCIRAENNPGGPGATFKVDLPLIRERAVGSSHERRVPAGSDQNNQTQQSLY